MADSVKVRIFGQEYSITGDKTPEEIEKIASYVDEKMKLISKVTGGGSVSGVPALTCLNIAVEYFDALSRMDRLRTEKEKAVNLCIKIKNAIESLSNPRERDVLYMRYIVGGYRLMKYDEIAEGMNYSERQVYRIYEKGIEHIVID